MQTTTTINNAPGLASSSERPGVTTTEFWMSLSGVVLSFVTALLALLTPGFTIPPAVQQLVVAFAPLAAMVSAAVYTLGRSRVKAAAQGATAAVAAAVASTQLRIDADTAVAQKAWDLAVLADDAAAPAKAKATAKRA